MQNLQSKKGMKGFISASSVKRRLQDIGCQMSSEFIASLNTELDKIILKSAERAKTHRRKTVRSIDL